MHCATSAAIVAAALVVAACADDGGDDGSSAPPGEVATDDPSDEANGTDQAPATDPAVTSDTSDTSDDPDASSDEEGEPLDQSLGPVGEPYRHPATARTTYFVMPDRFANGDPSNDTAGIDGGPLDHGFLPTDRAYHHGGDLAGLTARLDYLDALGIDAIWITPPFTNRFVQGDGTVEGSTSSYHGYWQIDWSRIDPHLGTDDDMRAFIEAAHERDIHVYFDVVINHTGDVITFEEGTFVYQSTTVAPWVDASGNEFDPTELAGSAEFPALDPTTSFPYTPTFAVPDDAVSKSPEWLNDVTLYHNRGNSTFSGESDTWGDFFGLDDLFTEHPLVVEGMIELHTDLIERFDVDGFRVDTVKHVNPEFWAEFVPAIRAAAAERGDDDFFVFGEVFNTDPISQSSYTLLGFSSTLDFIVDAGLERYVAGGGAGPDLAGAFDDDDWFTDPDGNASTQVKFFGNHDAGRRGFRIDSQRANATPEQLLAAARLGDDLLFLTRGVPVVYYGDEQGFTGTGGDQLARQDMFPSVTPDYVDDESIGSAATPADDNFDTSHPLYVHVQQLDALRESHPAFISGAQYTHDTEGTVFAFSRIDRDERVEHLVVANSHADQAVETKLRALTPSASFTSLRDDEVELTSDELGDIQVIVPPLSSLVLRAGTPLEPPADEPVIRLVRPEPDTTVVTPRYRFEAELDDRRYAEVTFAVSVDGGEPEVLGVDDAPPYRVYWSNAHVGAGTSVEVIATVADGSGRSRSDVVTVALGDRT